MTKQLLGALAALMITGTMAMAQVQAPACQKDACGTDCCQKNDCCQKVCCDACCCCGPRIDFEVAATFMRYHREDGVVNNAGDNVEFDFDAGWRIGGTYHANNGLAYRLRYWDHDADAGDISVDTHNIDFSVVYEVELDCCTCLEVSTGIRYNDFEEDGVVSALGGAAQRFDGYGVMVGLELTRQINCNTTLYTRINHAIMMEDAELEIATAPTPEVVDVTRAITELGFGVEYCYCGWNLHAGIEWSDWGSYVRSRAPLATAGGTESIGFAGYVVGAEFNY